MSEAFPVTWEDSSDPDLSWEWDGMHTPHALAPLAGDYTRVVAGGMTYRYERFGVPKRLLCRIINGYAYFAEQVLVPETELARIRELETEGRRAQARVVREFWDRTVFPTLLETYSWMRGAPIETAPLAEVAGAWDELWRRLPHLWGLHFMTNAGSYRSLNELADLYESLVEGAHPGEALTLAQGLPNELQRVQRDLYLLTGRARSLPAVAGLIERDLGGALAEIPGVKGGPQFMDTLREFLKSHGHLGQPFDDLTLPSWEDEPALVLAEIRKRLLHAGEDPETQRLRLRAEAQALANRVRERLRDRPDDLQRFEEALGLACEAGPLTEAHNYWLDRMLHAHLHRFALRVGRRLAEASIISDPRDDFFLHVKEIGQALRDPRDLRAVVARRRAEHDRWSAAQPPKYLGKPPDPSPPPDRFEPPPTEQAGDERVLRGLGASAGTGRGPARVVLSPDDFGRVQPGDVLVCASSNPSWVPLFGIIAGLVTNTGGVLAHASVVAREFGVPAVVGTGDATQRLRDGQRVEVDGTAGEVRIL